MSVEAPAAEASVAEAKATTPAALGPAARTRSAPARAAGEVPGLPGGFAEVRRIFGYGQMGSVAEAFEAETTATAPAALVPAARTARTRSAPAGHISAAKAAGEVPGLPGGSPEVRRIFGYGQMGSVAEAFEAEATATAPAALVQTGRTRSAPALGISAAEAAGEVPGLPGGYPEVRRIFGYGQMGSIAEAFEAETTATAPAALAPAARTSAAAQEISAAEALVAKDSPSLSRAPPPSPSPCQDLLESPMTFPTPTPTPNI